MHARMADHESQTSEHPHLLSSVVGAQPNALFLPWISYFSCPLAPRALSDTSVLGRILVETFLGGFDGFGIGGLRRSGLRSSLGGRTALLLIRLLIPCAGRLPAGLLHFACVLYILLVTGRGA